MAAYNWIIVPGQCPVCGATTSIKCQTHVASSYSGFGSGRFMGYEYRLGEPMQWWAKDHPWYSQWRVHNRKSEEPDLAFNEEACYSSCSSCGAELCVVIRFHECVPEQVLLITRQEDWPAEYLK